MPGSMNQLTPQFLHNLIMLLPRCRQNQRLCKGESFRAFCLHTSLHGWRHLADRSQPRVGATERSMWAAVVFLAVVTAATFLYNNTWVSALVRC